MFNNFLRTKPFNDLSDNSLTTVNILNNPSGLPFYYDLKNKKISRKPAKGIFRRFYVVPKKFNKDKYEETSFINRLLLTTKQKETIEELTREQIIEHKPKEINTTIVPLNINTHKKQKTIYKK